MADSPIRKHKFLIGLVGTSALLFVFCDCVLAVLHCVLLGLGASVLGVVGLHIAFGSSVWRSEEYIQDAYKKAVLITGCDTGFGHRLARRLAHMGFRVYAGCLSPEAEGAQQLARDANIMVLGLDVTRQADVDACLATVSRDLDDRGGGVQLWSIVNNAGVLQYAPCEFMSTSQLRHTMEVNVLGAVAVTKAFLPLLRRAKEGRVVNTVSVAGRTSFPGIMAYCMSKHAGVAFCDSLRHELRSFNLTVHSIEPAGYRTSILDQQRLDRAAEESWASGEPEVKAAYGLDFYNDRAKVFFSWFGLATLESDKIYQVIDDMAHAVAAVKPKVRYMPSWIAKSTNVLVCLMPMEILDIVGTWGVTVTPLQMATTS